MGLSKEAEADILSLTTGSVRDGVLVAFSDNLKVSHWMQRPDQMDVFISVISLSDHTGGVVDHAIVHRGEIGMNGSNLDNLARNKGKRVGNALVEMVLREVAFMRWLKGQWWFGWAMWVRRVVFRKEWPV